MDNASKTRRLLFRLGTVLILIGICVVMMIIGRGHTVYFDNKKLDHEGITYDCPYKVKVLVKGEQVANLKAKERGMATTIGQDFEMTLKITQDKGGDEVEETYSLKLPYNLDGIVVNLPAYLAGLPEEVPPRTPKRKKFPAATSSNWTIWATSDPRIKKSSHTVQG